MNSASPATVDLYDEDVDDSVIGSRDWMKSESIVSKDGYREGLAQGQEVKLQEGFNRGFMDGCSEVKDIAHLRGRICATLSLNHILKTDLGEDKIKQLEDLLISARELEEKCLKMDRDSAKESLKNTETSIVVQTEPKKEGMEPTCGKSELVKITNESTECDNTGIDQVHCERTEKDQSTECDNTGIDQVHCERTEKDQSTECDNTGIDQVHCEKTEIDQSPRDSEDNLKLIEERDNIGGLWMVENNQGRMSKERKLTSGLNHLLVQFNEIIRINKE